MDRIVPYACRGTNEAEGRIPGLFKRDVPNVLPPNLGTYGPTPYHIDLTVSGIKQPLRISL